MRILLRGSGIPGVTDPDSACERTSWARHARNWVLAILGFVSLGLGLIGIWVPGLPTTIFLIVASWLFTRSCPAIDRWMRSLGPVRPFVRFLDGDPIPSRLVAWIVFVICVAASVGIAATGSAAARGAIALAAAIGSWVVIQRRERVGYPTAGSVESSSGNERTT